MSTSELSVPWARTSLLNTPTYVASTDFVLHVSWLKSSNQSDLMAVSTDLENATPSRATCAVVGRISPNRLYLEPHGNFNPNFEKTALETSKAQFQIVAPTHHPEFDEDFARGVKHLETVQRMAFKEGPPPEHFVVTDGGQKALKFSCPLFEKREHPYDPTDEEDWSNDYPIALKYKDLFDDVITRWRATPLPAFDTAGKLIKVHELEVSLRGALVLVHFELKHYSIRDRRTNGVASNTVCAIATQVIVLERGTKARSSPYKTMMLKGPTMLPQSSTKKADQTNAVAAFHPAAVKPTAAVKPVTTVESTAALEPTAAAVNLQVSTKVTRTTPVSAKAEGKKRAVDEDGDATATDEDVSVPDKNAKKRKTQHK